MPLYGLQLIPDVMRNKTSAVEVKCSATAAAALVWLLSCSTVFAATYSRSAEYAPIRATTAQIITLVRRVESFLQSANSTLGPTTYRRSGALTFAGVGAELELKSPILSEKVIGEPRPTTSIRYTFYTSEAPISHVEISLADYSRDVTTSGTSKEQVDALFSLIDSDLRELEGGFGGPLLRVMGGLTLLLVGAIITAASTLHSLPTAARLTMFFSGILMQLSIWILPWQAWLPGTLVLPDASSILERYSPLMSLFGLLIAIATAGVPVVRWLARRSDVQPDRVSGEEDDALDHRGDGL